MNLDGDVAFLVAARVPRRLARFATLALIVAPISGCSQAEQEAFNRTLLLLLVAAAAVYAVTLTVLIVGIVKLLRNAPSTSWGVTALVLGALTGLPSIASFVRGSHVASASVFVGAGLIYVGLLHVRNARRVGAQPQPPTPPPGSAA